MTQRGKTYVAGGAICLAVYVFAFVAAPNSCEWGLGAYFWSGVAGVILLLATPFIFRMEYSPLARTGLGIGLAALGILVWVAGLFVANVRLICRLF